MGECSTTIYAARTVPLEDAGLFSCFYRMIPESRKRRVESAKVDSERRQALAASVLWLHGLKAAGAGDDYAEGRLNVALNDAGKPFFPERENLHFSISHSGEWALCGFSTVSIGCDVQEHYREDEAILTVAHRYFSEEERRLISSEEDADDRIRLLYRLWTMKESYAKMVGCGIDDRLPRIGIRSENGCLRAEGLGDAGFLHELAVAEGYSAACCVAAGGSRPVCALLNLTDLLE